MPPDHSFASGKSVEWTQLLRHLWIFLRLRRDEFFSAGKFTFAHVAESMSIPIEGFINEPPKICELTVTTWRIKKHMYTHLRMQRQTAFNSKFSAGRGMRG